MYVGVYPTCLFFDCLTVSAGGQKYGLEQSDYHFEACYSRRGLAISSCHADHKEGIYLPFAEWVWLYLSAVCLSWPSPGAELPDAAEWVGVVHWDQVQNPIQLRWARRA